MYSDYEEQSRYPEEELYREWHQKLDQDEREMAQLRESWLITAAASSGDRAERFERSEEPGEAGPGNTAIYSSQWVVSGGVDYLEVTVYGRFGYGYAEVQEKLEAARLASMGRNGSGYVEVVGATLIMRKTGHPWVDTFMHWVGDYDGMRFSLAKQGQADRCPVAKVQIGSLKLIRDGHLAAWEHAKSILSELGISIDRTTVSRIDICVDLPGVSVEPFCEAILNEQAITRIKSQGAFYKTAAGQWSGVAVGKRQGVLLRIYDKLEEIKVNTGEAAAKKQAMLERRWGVMPEASTRAEFQINGGWLRTKWQGFNTVEEVFEKLDVLSAYLCRQYFRLVEGHVDRENKNQSRLETSPLWQTVDNAFLSWVEKSVIPLIKREKKPIDRERAGKRIVSAALAFAALRPDFVDSRETLVQSTLDALLKHLGPDHEWLQKIALRWDKMVASGELGTFTLQEQPREYSSGCRVILEWDEWGAPPVAETRSELVPF